MTGLKFSQRKDGTLEVRGLGIPFGGPINGKDLHGQFFSTKTDFAWDLIPDGARPLLYQHGLDDTVKTEVVGRWGVEKVDAKGVWVRAQLSARSSYLSEIKELLTEDALGLSSATMGHLVKVNQKNGEILNWPVVELSLTPNPANPTAYVVKSMVTPARHAAKLLRVLKHGDHDQSEHGNRDGASGGGSDDKPSGSSREEGGSRPPMGSSFSSSRSNAEGNVRSIAEDVDKLREDRTIDPAVRDKIGTLQDLIKRMSGEINDADPATDKNMITRGVLSTLGKMHGQVGDIVESLQDDWVFDDLRPLLEELDNELESFEGAFNAAAKKSYGRKHGDHDQSEHGNRDGAGSGGSDSGDKPSSEPNDPPGRSNEARAANPRNGNRSLPWRGRTFDPSGYPPKAMAEAKEYAKESLAKIEQHIKPIDPTDDDDIRFANDEKSALTSSITVAMDQLKEGNVGGALSNLMRASSRASRNDEAKELTDALDFLYDRTAATFGLDDVVNPDNLGRFKDIRESARTHFRNLPKKSLKADFLNEDAEEGEPEEEANEESDTLEQSIAKLVESTEYTLGEIAEALAKATDENNEVIVNCLTESQDALEKLAGELATYLEGTSPTDEVEDETETETLLASPVASLAILAGKRSRAEEDLAAVKAALKAEIRKQTLVAIGRTRDRK